MTLFKLLSNPMKVVRNYNRLERMAELYEEQAKEQSDIIKDLTSKIVKHECRISNLEYKNQQLHRLTGDKGTQQKVLDQRAALAKLQSRYDEQKELNKQLREDNDKLSTELVELKLRYEHYGIHYKENNE